MNLKKYVIALRWLPCMVCGQLFVELHHPVGGSIQERLGCRGNEKHSDWLQIPLCFDHHSAQGKDGIHKGIESWEAVHGTQVSMIDTLSKRFGLDLWKLAEKPSKIIPHKGVEML